MNTKVTCAILLVSAASLAAIRSSARESAAPQCFNNRGIKTFNRICLHYVSPVAVEGTLQTVQNGRTDTLTVAFSGAIRQGRIFPEFESTPQALGPETEWTTRPWELRAGASSKATLHVPVRSKIVNSKNQYRNTDFVFTAVPLR